MTCAAPDSSSVTASDLRSHLARWPTGVAVITARGNGRPIGKTVNSFHATSLQPPLVGWCIDHNSSQFEEWMATTGYVVHVMAPDHTDLISRFATSTSDRFAGLEHVEGYDAMPMLAQEVPLRLACHVVERIPVGDHTYLIGAVKEIVATDAVPLVLQR